MNIVYIVYHDLSTEARSAEVLEALEKIGNVSVVSTAVLPSKFKSTDFSIKYNEMGRWTRYLAFLKRAKHVLRTKYPDIVVLHDSINLIRYAQRIANNPLIVLDQSELKFDRKNNSITAIILNAIAAISYGAVKDAEVVICANKERAALTKEHYGLVNKPIVFNNMHKIEDPYDETECYNKYNRYLYKDKKLLVYGGGVSEDRLTYDIARAIISRREQWNLIICGAAPEGVDKLRRLIEYTDSADCVHYLGFIPREEWRFLLHVSTASFVAFKKNCLNNTYCASGKLYESIFEGTPIIATTNPPLVSLCKEHHIGVTEDDLSNALDQMAENYTCYKESVMKYAQSINYRQRIDELSNELQSRMNIGH